MRSYLVALGGFGFTIAGTFTSINSSTRNSSPFIGSHPFSVMYFSINLRSNIEPLLGDNTGTSGTSFDTISTNQNNI
uniref:CSON008770 protein n=1 Tax=Culicoides sonorensis TaxID=179676 RepID=A0A336MZ31_CULSO